MKFLHLPVLISFILTPLLLFAQFKGAPYIRNFSADEYNAHAQVWCAVQDKAGVMYFGTTTGIAVYDGETWRRIEISNSSIIRSLNIDDNGVIYVGGIKTFGRLIPDSTGKLEYESINAKIDSANINFSSVWETIVIEDKVYFRSPEFLFQYSPVKDSLRWYRPKKRFNPAFYMPGYGLVVRDLMQYYYLEDNQFKPLPKSTLLADKFIYKMLPFSEKSFIGITDQQLFEYNLSVAHEREPAVPFRNVVANKLRQAHLYMGTVLNSGELAIGSLTKGVFVIDSTGNFYRNYNKNHGLQMNHVWNAFQGENSTLWLTLDKGISSVQYDVPVRIWNAQTDFDESVNDIIEFQGRMYFSTMSGVYFLDKTPDGNFATMNPQQLDKEIISCWSFSIIIDPKTGNEELIVATSNGPAYVKRNKLEPVYELSYNYDLVQHPYNPDLLFVSGLNKVDVVHYENFSKKYTIKLDGQARYFDFDKKQNLWVGTNYKGIYKISRNKTGDYKKVELFDTARGFERVLQLKPYLINNQLIVSSTQGIYRYNERTNKFDTFDIPLKAGNSVQISALEMFNDQQNLCVLTNNELYRFAIENGEFASVDSTKYRSFATEQIHNIYVDSRNNLWAAGPAGIFLYDENHPSKMSFEPRVNIRKVIFMKDSVLFNGTYFSTYKNITKTLLQQPKNMQPELPYQHNAIVFDYASPFYFKNFETKYAYKLRGFDEQWSEWTRETRKEYTNLPPGDYTFAVKAKSVFKIPGKISIYKFTIVPPWYMTIWAYIFYVILFFILVLLIIRMRTRALQKQNKLLEEQVTERTAQIKSKNELLKNQKEHLEVINTELKKLSIAASETNNAIIIMNKDGDIEWINEGFTKLYGYNLVEFHEKFGENIHSASTLKNVDELFKTVLRDKKPQIYESQITTKKGTVIDTQTTLSPIMDSHGEITRVVAIDSDIRQLKRAENELKKLNATKDKFFSIVAHDLKNPFGSVMQLSELTYQNIKKWDQDKLTYMVKNIFQASKQGYDLLINLLEWSRAQTGRIKIQPEVLNLSSLIQQNLNLFSAQKSQKELRIINNVNESLNVRTDRNSTLTVFRNIISNAIKFTPQGGQIVITAFAKNGFIVTQIADTGVGIPPEKLDKLFRIDQNINTPGTENESGTGLGLIVCKEFVEKNGGSIHVESTEGEGTTFYIKLKKG